jgi:hypothetical protein
MHQVAESLRVPVQASRAAAIDLPQNLQSSYREFLNLVPGGYTQDNMFHFFGPGGHQDHHLSEWNSEAFWKKWYGLGNTEYVFAENLFGTQFYFDIRDNRRAVYMLVPATGRRSLCANTFADFLEDEILSDDFNQDERRLAATFLESSPENYQCFQHISYRVPILLGGSATAFENLELLSSRTNMKILGQIYQQVKHLGAGTKIKDFKVDYGREIIILVLEE